MESRPAPGVGVRIKSRTPPSSSLPLPGTVPLIELHEGPEAGATATATAPNNARSKSNSEPLPVHLHSTPTAAAAEGTSTETLTSQPGQQPRHNDDGFAHDARSESLGSLPTPEPPALKTSALAGSNSKSDQADQARAMTSNVSDKQLGDMFEKALTVAESGVSLPTSGQDTVNEARVATAPGAAGGQGSHSSSSAATITPGSISLSGTGATAVKTSSAELIAPTLVTSRPGPWPTAPDRNVNEAKDQSQGLQNQGGHNQARLHHAGIASNSVGRGNHYSRQQQYPPMSYQPQRHPPRVSPPYVQSGSGPGHLQHAGGGAQHGAAFYPYSSMPPYTGYQYAPGPHADYHGQYQPGPPQHQAPLVYPIDSSSYASSSSYMQSPPLYPLQSPTSPYSDSMSNGATGTSTYATSSFSSLHHQQQQQQHTGSGLSPEGFPSHAGPASPPGQPALSVHSISPIDQAHSARTSPETPADLNNGAAVTYGSDASPALNPVEAIGYRPPLHHQHAMHPVAAEGWNPAHQQQQQQQAYLASGISSGYYAPPELSAFGLQYPISHSRPMSHQLPFRPHISQHRPGPGGLPFGVPYSHASQQPMFQQQQQQQPYPGAMGPGYQYGPQAPPPPPPPSFAPGRKHGFAADPGPALPRFLPQFSPTSPNATEPASFSPPQIYAPPTGELARGHLAQSRFHDAVFDRGTRYPSQAPAHERRRSSASGGVALGADPDAGEDHRLAELARLPRPPVHSPHALWVGNVPSDATHAELWRFFKSRPAPAYNPRFAGVSVSVSAGSGQGQLEDDSSNAHRALDGDSNVPPRDLHSPGIDSIHLIQKSNCAFVNYATDVHLQHAIEVAHGRPLRPHDPRCKDLVCRVRKKGEDVKSGVGAQRVGGMHKDFVREQMREKREEKARERELAMVMRELDDESTAEGTARRNPDDVELVQDGHLLNAATLAAHGASGKASDRGNADRVSTALHAQRDSTSSTLRSVSNASTTSSFLAKHFQKRYFILKSHDESDLQLSVETGLWATQSHNEPVLDQAFHTATDVYLIFGANRRGEFFGYARMGSAIHESKKGKRGSSGADVTSGEDSQTSSSSGLSKQTHASTSTRPDTIPEHSEAVDFSPRQQQQQQQQPITPAPMLFGDAENRFAESSPLPLTPGGTRPLPGSTPVSSLSPAARREFEAAGGRPPDFTLSNSSLPRLPDSRVNDENDDALNGDGVAASGRPRGESLDPRLLVKRQEHSSGHAQSDGVQAAMEQQKAGSSNVAGETDDDGVWRKDTLPTAEERNARLEQLDDTVSSKRLSSGSSGWGHPFKVEWIKVARLSFANTRHIRNSFNSGREVKISRDGTELEPSAGESLLAAFEALTEADGQAAHAHNGSKSDMAITPKGPSPTELDDDRHAT